MRPAFILCSARSRSTLLSAMLGRHSRIFATPELLLFTADTLGGVLSPPTPDYPAALVAKRRSGLVRLVAELDFGGQHPGALTQAAGWLRAQADRPPTWLLEHVLARVDAEVVLEKSPDTTSTEANLERCLSYRPDARFIALLRNPWAVVDSMWRHWDRITPQSDPASLARRCAVACYTSARTLAAALPTDDAADDRWLTVRSEDLTERPGPVLRAAAEHLGVGWSPDELERCLHPEGWVFASSGTAGELGGGDPNFLAGPSFSPFADRADYRSRMVPLLVDSPQAVDALDSLTASLGYEVRC